MWNQVSRIFSGLPGKAAGYLGALATAALSVMLAGALVGDLAFGQVWVVGALCGGLLTVAAGLFVLVRLNRAPAENPVNEAANWPELAPFSFTIGGPGLQARFTARPAVMGALTRKERFDYAA